MATRAGSKDAQPGDILLVVHDFVARSIDELSLAKGDRVSLIEGDSEFGDGWFLGRHLTNGTTGLFPEVYTTPAPKGTLNNPAKPRINDLLTPSATSVAPSTLASQNAAPSAVIPASQLRPNGAPNPQAANAQSGLRSSVPSTSGSTRSFTITSDSPVMSETLSVIDEHMSDMKAPRSPNSQANKRDTLSSVYSANPAARRSYIAGHETDEEEQELAESEVMAWSPARVAEYLADHGVEQSHCDVFKEQDISGEVLLGLDQNSLFIKEFELGSVGRRLKTWHKIKALQDEVRRSGSAAAGRNAGGNASRSDAYDTSDSKGRSSNAADVLPRALTTSRRVESSDGTGRTQSNIQASSAVQGQVLSIPLNELPAGVIPRPASRPDGFYRPSAQTIRDMNHARRHSSMDSTSTDGAARFTHKKQPSIDASWQLGQMPASGVRGHAYSGSIDSQFPHHKTTHLAVTSSTEIDRGYFSSNEVEVRPRKANVLQKRLSTTAPSPSHSRTSSILDLARTNGGFSRHSYVGDPRGSGSTVNSTAQTPNTLGIRSESTAPTQSSTSPELLTTPTPSSKTPETPMVTRLDQNARTFPSAKDGSSDPNANNTPSPTGLNQGFFSAARAKVAGLRSISDAVTRSERSTAPSKSGHKDSNINSPTTPGSSTPSTTNPSMELAKVDSHSRMSTGSGGAGAGPMNALPTVKRPRAKTKTKKDTSAYTRGLEKKSPAEQMHDCDYSGWMKKKSGSLMTTWKPRLFILRGRRLSYYYAEDDAEEKGLIDISFHRVLPAHHETITGLHATVTGASGSSQSSPHLPLPGHSSQTSPGSTLPPTMSQQDMMAHPPSTTGESDDSGLFIFKLVPPKAGLSKGVNFTKPTVHYFAVSSRQEGRLWMAALMKATIDRDDQSSVTTTYNQKTISLAKARARRERPPALREDGPAAPTDSSITASAANIPNTTAAATTFYNDDDDETSPKSQAAPARDDDTTTSDPNSSDQNHNGLGIGGLRDSLSPTAPAESDITSASSLLGHDLKHFQFPADASSLAPSTATGTTTTDHTAESSEYGYHVGGDKDSGT